MPELFMIIATGTVRGYNLSSGFNVLINLYFLYSSPAYVRAFKAHPISLIKAGRFASVVASQLLLLFLARVKPNALASSKAARPHFVRIASIACDLVAWFPSSQTKNAHYRRFISIKYLLLSEKRPQLTVLSCLVLSCLVLSCLVLSCLVLSCLVCLVLLRLCLQTA